MFSNLIVTTTAIDELSNKLLLDVIIQEQQLTNANEDLIDLYQKNKDTCKIIEKMSFWKRWYYWFINKITYYINKPKEIENIKYTNDIGNSNPQTDDEQFDILIDNLKKIQNTSHKLSYILQHSNKLNCIETNTELNSSLINKNKHQF